MGWNESALSKGYYLPQPPREKRVSIHDLRGGFRTHIYTGVPNLGDCYNYYLYGIVSGLKNFKGEKQGPLLCQVGSILDRQCDVIWGSGLISDHEVIFADTGVDVFATRGPDTLKRLKNIPPSQTTSFGDPGLLASLIFPLPHSAVSTDFCVIPHYIDHDNPTVKRLMMKENNETEGHDVRLLNIETCSFNEFVEDLGVSVI